MSKQNKVIELDVDRKRDKKMKFVDPNIEKEYNRLCAENTDIEGLPDPLINVSDVLKAYFALADYFSDPSSNAVESMLIGVNRVNLLYSALIRQVVSFGNKTKYTNPIDVCSTLFFGLVKNHSFCDGNKRTALLILLYQLNQYNYLPKASVKEFERLVVATAANTLSKQYASIWKKYQKFDDCEIKTIAHFLRKNTSKKDHSYHLKITIKDMASALEQYDVKHTVENGKVHFERILQSSWLGPKKTLRYSINFGGWTRCIGASTAREILSNLELYDQIPDYQSFIDGNELFYSLIEEFEGPFRRLKDE